MDSSALRAMSTHRDCWRVSRRHRRLWRRRYQRHHSSRRGGRCGAERRRFVRQGWFGRYERRYRWGIRRRRLYECGRARRFAIGRRNRDRLLGGSPMRGPNTAVRSEHWELRSLSFERRLHERRRTQSLQSRSRSLRRMHHRQSLRRRRVLCVAVRIVRIPLHVPG